MTRATEAPAATPSIGRQAIEARDLTVGYGDQIVFQNLNFALPAQGVTAILGPSGCGKSTLLSVMNRLIDTVPQAQVSGQLYVGGENVLDPNTDLAELRRKVGLILQRPCPFPVSIARNFRIPLREIGIRRPKRQDAIIEECLTAVGLWNEVRGRLSEPATQLSGGQQQRLCLARALAVDPQVLLLDEPSTSLDPNAREHVEATVTAIAETHPTVLVTHELQQAQRLADHVLLLWPTEDGPVHVAATGPLQSALESCCEPEPYAYLQQGLGDHFVCRHCACSLPTSNGQSPNSNSDGNGVDTRPPA